MPTWKNKTVARVSDEAVFAKTGKHWDEWFLLLDRAGGRMMEHKQRAVHLRDKCGLPAWWSQMVAVGYEQDRGLREKHQKPAGYEISSSKTVSVSVARLYQAWEEPETRSRWLKQSGMMIRKSTPRKSMRITWGDGTSVDVGFYPSGEDKSQVCVQHGRLADAAAAERAKTEWGQRLERLKALLEQ